MFLLSFRPMYLYLLVLNPVAGFEPGSCVPESEAMTLNSPQWPEKNLVEARVTGFGLLSPFGLILNYDHLNEIYPSSQE
jgi:hypothetical protein